MNYNDLTQNKFLYWKTDYPIYGTYPTVDKYGNEQLITMSTPKGSIHVMWQPVTDEVSVRLWGVGTREMLSCVCYDDTPLEEHDQIIIGDWKYEIVSIKVWHTHRQLMIKKLVRISSTPPHTDYEPYTGTYEVIPRIYDQFLATKGKGMDKDVTVYEIPETEVSNEYGTTVRIG